MAKNHTEEKVSLGKKLGIVGRNIKKLLKAKSNESMNYKSKVIIILLVCVISSIFLGFISKPAMELKFAERDFIEARHELRAIEEKGTDTEEYKVAKEKYDKADTVLAGAEKDYLLNSNVFISGYASINSELLQLGVFIILAIPFIVLFGFIFIHPVMFIFLTINLLVVLPLSLIKKILPKKQTKKITKTNNEPAAA